MTLGRVHIWTPDPSHPHGGTVRTSIVELPRLRKSAKGLSGKFVSIRNAGALNLPAGRGSTVRPAPIGNAQSDAAGNFVFDHYNGGERVDGDTLVPDEIRQRYVEASHFGEVNSYYHLDRIASYITELRQELGAGPMPPVTAVVNAHHAATEQDGRRDGEWHDQQWRPFQGGHYRLPSWRYDVAEHQPISPRGEIHLGPGRKWTDSGALSKACGDRYLHNASHNAGTLYHEYGHHINRHSADFRANALRPPELQSNRKIPTDEGTCDYWAATMLGSPHIWAWHQRHDDQIVHRRSLASGKSMADFDHRSGADPHANGTIWAAALWDLRTRLALAEPEGARQTDLLVLQALLLIGRRAGTDSTAQSASRAREGFSVALSALLEADEQVADGRHRQVILATFAGRGIHPLEDSAEVCEAKQ